ncbi:ribosomal protein S18-alanine N-acetyltransferase [Zhihengliuella salsuginis]|nr:ribosomal protein S18-alanine N-acetyltransferase [Zhihengliuella salsuginis]
MTADDVEQVYPLETRLFPEDAWPRDMFEAEVAQTDTRRYWVAEADGRVVGYAGMMCVLPIADVQTIAVVPEFEGRGIGTALLEAMIGESRARGADNLLLEVREDNPRAQQLYTRHGFEQIHVRRNYYPGGVSALIMELRLA